MTLYPHTSPRQSLRYRYLLLATIMAISLIIGAGVASWYVKDVSTNNANSLHMKDEVSDVISNFRRSFWNVNQIVNSLMVTSDSEHHKKIIFYLNLSEQQIRSLQDNKIVSKDKQLSLLAQDLQEDFEVLRGDIEQLIKFRGDINWVYPMLPFIRTTLNESNTEFETAVDLALNEIESESGGKYKNENYHKFHEIRDLWRSKILNFRAVIIRFAGLNVSRDIAQEKNIEIIHNLINKSISELYKINEETTLGFETEVALEIMKYRSEKWYKDFLELKKIRESGVWRSDLVFFENKIQPDQEHILMDINALEERLSEWSANKISIVEDVAYKINVELWGLSALGLLFVGIVYIMLDRYLLLPIAKISDAISTEGGNIDHMKLPRFGSREIHTLISSFNSMRQQIHQRQIALERQALTDSLTGLPNRALLNDRLGQSIQSAKRDDKPMTLLILDLDRFKDINDTLGHQTGDIMLQKIGERLNNCVRSSDTVARMGGDEFAVVCPDGDKKAVQSLIDKIVECIEEEIEVEGQHLYVGASIGVALYPQDGEDIETLIRHADIAMYAAKNSNKSYIFFDKNLDQHSIEDLSLLRDLRTEITNPTGQISVHYQPQINLFSREVIGAEALLRWEHPAYGYIPPDKFIRIAEQSGLISNLSFHVLERAIADCANWNQQNINIDVSVNLSVHDLQNPELATMVSNCLEEAGLDENKLCLEITESVVMHDPVRAREVLTQLHNMGIKLYIDDYGTGFSSLAYIKLLPIDGLKIDKSFVIDMLEDENDFIIVRSTIDMAHSLGLQVIAEGVEQHEALLKLRNQKCDFAQGFDIARPMAEESFQNWMHNYQPRMVQ